MSQYRNKINLLQDRITKLKEQEKEIVKKRKERVGELADQFNLLTFSDECLVGIFLEFNTNVHTYPSQIKKYEEKGECYFKQKRNRQSASSNSSAVMSDDTAEATYD